MPDLKLVVVVPNKGSSPVEAPSDMLVADFLVDIMASAHVTGEWFLDSKELGRELDNKLTLEQNGLRPDYHVILRQRAIVVPDPAAGKKPLGIGAIAALVVIAALAGTAAGYLIGRGGNSGSGLEARLAELQDQLAAKQEQISQLEQRLVEQGDNVGDNAALLQDKIRELDAQVLELQTELEAANDKYARASTELQAAQARLAGLGTTSQQSQAQLLKAQQDAVRFKTEAQAMQERLDRSLEDAQAARAEAARLARQVKELQSNGSSAVRLETLTWQGNSRKNDTIRVSVPNPRGASRTVTRGVMSGNNPVAPCRIFASESVTVSEDRCPSFEFKILEDNVRSVVFLWAPGR